MAVLDSADAEAQMAFSGAVAALLRESRIRQGLTQAQVSARTGGLVSKAALANYETGHRSLRVDVFWLLVRALGEDAGVTLTSAERRSGYGRSAESLTALTVDTAALMASTDPRLAPVQRWFAVRLQPGKPAVRTVTLDDGALAALSSLMGVSPEECRALLVAAATPSPSSDPAADDAAGGEAVQDTIGPVAGHGAQGSSPHRGGRGAGESGAQVSPIDGLRFRPAESSRAGRPDEGGRRLLNRTAIASQ